MASSTVTADYALTPAELDLAIESMVLIQQPLMIWGAPGIGKSEVAAQVAKRLGRIYIDVRALLLDPVDLRGIPWRDEHNMTRWAPPAFLPREDSTDLYLINLEELPSAPPMVQAALYQLVQMRRCGEYVLPAGASLIACGNRITDNGVAHKMPTPLASRFEHVEAKADADSWTTWAASSGRICSEVMFFISLCPELISDFDPKRKERSFPCPRTWEFVSNLVKSGGTGNETVDTALFCGAVGEAAAVQFSAFLDVCNSLAHPSVIINNPLGAPIPEDPAALIATCGSLYRVADKDTMPAICAYASRSDFRKEIGEFLIGQCVTANPEVQNTQAFMQWASNNSKA